MLDDLQKLEPSILSKMQAMMSKLLAPKPNPIPIDDPKVSAGGTPSKANPFPLLDFAPEKDKSLEKDKLEDSGASSPEWKEETKGVGHLGDNHPVTPPGSYSANVPIPMPHIVSQGSPPLLDCTSFKNWQFFMQSHVRSSSTEL
jgi:hypothetical protein